MKSTHPTSSVFANPIVRRYGITALLATTLVGVTGVIGFETDWGQSFFSAEIPPAKAAAHNLEQSLLPQYVLPPIDPTYKETVERPLFVQTRRPAPAAVTTAVVTMRKGQYRLTGTSINESVTVAFFVDVASGKAFRAVKGAEVGQSSGIKLDAVEPTRVVLRQGDETEELSLRTSASPRIAVAANNPGQPMPPGQTPGQPPSQPQPPGGFSPQANNPGQFNNSNAAQAGVAGAPQFQPPGAVANANASGNMGAKPPVEPSSTNPNPQANQGTQPADPNAAVLRRRRFQNLPQ